MCFEYWIMHSSTLMNLDNWECEWIIGNVCDWECANAIGWRFMQMETICKVYNYYKLKTLCWCKFDVCNWYVDVLFDI